MYLSKYHKRCCHHWRPVDVRRVGVAKGAFKGFNTGGLLWGEKGCGKSQILAYITAWAHENNWVNLSFPHCDQVMEDLNHRPERMENGLYLQVNLAARLLNDIYTANEAAFKEMDVNLDLYGKIDMTGVHEDDDDPCPREYDPIRQCWSDDWKKFLYDSEIRFYEQRYKDLAYNLANRCPEP